LKREGVFANAHDIPDHIASAVLVAKDSRFEWHLSDSFRENTLTLFVGFASSLIVDGARYIRDSAQFQDLQRSITRWWRGESSAEEATQESH
jgi:hypothetical protein